MAIQVGDAVINCLLDLSNPDQAIANFTAQAGQKLKPVGDAVGQVSTAFDGAARSAQAAGTQAASAGDKISTAGKIAATGIKGANDATQQLTQRIKALETESVALQQQVQQLQAKLNSLNGEPVHRLGSDFHEAQGEAALLGEATGVTLPRHVRSFLASLPGVSAGLSAAFSATAVLFLAEAAVSLVEKIQDCINAEKESAEAWEGVQAKGVDALHKLGDEVLEEQKKIDELTHNYLAAFKDQLDLIDHASLKELSETFDEFGKNAGEVFDKVSEHSVWDFVVKGIIPSQTKAAREELDKFVKEFDDLLRAENQIGASNRLAAEILTVRDKLRELEAERRRFGDEDSEGIDREIQGYQRVFQVLQQMSAAFDQLAEKQKKQDEAASLEHTQKVLEDQAAAARRAFDLSIAKIEEFKAEQQAAYTQGKISADDWAEAQIKAANDSATANIKYKDTLAQIAREGPDGQKAIAAAADAATERIKQQTILIRDAAQAIQKARDEANNLRAEWDKQDFSEKKIADATQALDELTRAEQRLRQTQTQLNEVRIQADYSAQEEQIQRLAQFSVITEEEKERRLKVLYEKEREDAIRVLEDQQKQELAILENARAKFEAASKDALLPDAELADLKRKLDQAQEAYDRTEGQIIRVNDEARRKTAGLITAERELIAAQLAAAKAKQAELQQERALAAERGQDTSQIDKQIDATKKYENELQKLLTRTNSVVRTKPTWDSFFTDLTHKSLSTGKAFTQMGQLFADAMAQSVEAAVSGSQSFGDAMLALVKQTLAGLAGAAIGHVMTEIAKASSDFATAATLAADPFTAALAPGFIASGHAHLVAAAEWGAIGVGAAIGGAAIPSGGKDYTPGGNNTNVDIGAAGQSQQPSGGQNAPHFASGAVISRRMKATIGDSEDGGDATEAILPLEDTRAMDAIAGALVGRMVLALTGLPEQPIALPAALQAEVLNPQPFPRAVLAAGREALSLPQTGSIQRAQPKEVHHHEETVHVHVNMPVTGVYHDGNLDKLAPKMAKKISDAVSSGKARLKSTTTYRVTRRG